MGYFFLRSLILPGSEQSALTRVAKQSRSHVALATDESVSVSISTALLVLKAMPNEIERMGADSLSKLSWNVHLQHLNHWKLKCTSYRTTSTALLLRYVKTDMKMLYRVTMVRPFVIIVRSLSRARSYYVTRNFSMSLHVASFFFFKSVWTA